MKLLITGASGMIGGEVLSQSLAHPAVTSVVAFVRKELSAKISEHPKLRTVIVKDFANWAEDVLRPHADAAAMIWAIGSYDGNIKVDLEYPLAFIESMGATLEANGSRPPFRFVLLGGKFVRQNQEQKLWFMEEARKIKGLLEAKSTEFEKTHSPVWKTLVVKPGGVIERRDQTRGFLGTITSVGAILGENWSVRVEELGAFMTHLAVDGTQEETITENMRIVRKGKELLEEQKGDTEYKA